MPGYSERNALGKVWGGVKCVSRIKDRRARGRHTYIYKLPSASIIFSCYCLMGGRVRFQSPSTLKWAGYGKAGAPPHYAPGEGSNVGGQYHKFLFANTPPPIHPSLHRQLYSPIPSFFLRHFPSILPPLTFSFFFLFPTCIL